MKKINIAVVGATGAVGETMLEILETRKFPIDNLYCLASERSAGKRIQACQKTVVIQDLSAFDFTQADIALFSAGGSVSAEFAPIAAAAGCIVIDNTSHFRYEVDIPLVIPEVNGDILSAPNVRNIIANPNCSTIQMLVALKPIHDAVKIARINVATYQAVSGSGKSGVGELARQVADIFNTRAVECEVYPQQIAFNVLPQIDQFQANGYTKEEMKMVWETQKILNDDSIQVNPTAVRVPVFYGHSEALHIETVKKLSASAACELLRNAPGVELMDDPSELSYPTPAVHGANTDSVYVGRVREDISHPTGLDLWVVSDNVRKGAALNAVQIAEILYKNKWSN